jgi:hypothetical protein
MGSRAKIQCGRTSTGRLAPRIQLAQEAARHGAPSSGGVKQEKAVRKDITRKGGDGKTRAGARALRKAEVVEGDKDKEKVMGRVEAYYGRKRSIESIMSEKTIEKTLESILTESDEAYVRQFVSSNIGREGNLASGTSLKKQRYYFETKTYTSRSETGILL